MHGRVAQLHGVASVPVGPPKDASGVGDIGQLLAVFGKGDRFGGNAPQERLELFGLQVESGELAMGSPAHCEYFLSGLSRNRSIPVDGAGGQLNRVGGWLAEQPAPLIESPDLVPLGNIPA